MLSDSVKEIHEWIEKNIVNGTIDTVDAKQMERMEESVPGRDELLPDDYDVLKEDAIEVWNRVVQHGNNVDPNQSVDESLQQLLSLFMIHPFLKLSFSLFTSIYEQFERHHSFSFLDAFIIQLLMIATI